MDVKDITGSTKWYTWPPGINKITDNNLILNSFPPKRVKVNFTFDDIRLKSNVTTNKTIRFIKKSFFYTILGFTKKSHSRPLAHIDGFIRIVPVTYKSEKPINITGIDKIYLKCDCFNGSIVNGTRETILYSFPLGSPPGHKIYKAAGIKLFK